MLESGYVASAQGAEFEVVLTNDPDLVDLIWRGQAPPMGGFEQVAPEVYVRHAALSELDSVRRVQWRCEYRGEPFVVSADRGDNLLISYVGRNFQKAATLGLRVEDRDYIVGLVPRSEVLNLRKVEKQIWPAE